MMEKEGWGTDVTAKGAKTHYYKDGKSLCGKAVVKHFMNNFNKERTGSKYSCDCGICIKKQNEIIHAEPLCYRKYNY